MPMDVDKAAELTYDAALLLKGYWRDTTCPEMTLEHVASMWARWSDDMSDTKKCRWLGWMQACVVAMTYPYATLETMKKINRHCAKEETP